MKPQEQNKAPMQPASAKAQPGGQDKNRKDMESAKTADKNADACCATKKSCDTK